MQKIEWPIKYFTVIALLLLVVSCKKNKEYFELNGVFGFVWFETTGQNLYIEQNHRDYPIKFSKKSNQKYLNALWALKYEVLCFNSDGQNIMLEGTYSSENEEFILKRWYFEGIFFRVEKFELDDDQKYILKSSLTPDDFEHEIEIPYEDLVVRKFPKKFIKELRPENKTRSLLKFGKFNIWSWEKIKYKNGRLFNKFYEINLTKKDVIVFENGVEVKISDKSEIFVKGNLFKDDATDLIIEKGGNLSIGAVIYP